MSHFPDDHYAHCPKCGAHFGMGLASESGAVFVLCYCGARGPSVQRADYESNGLLNVSAMDEAARQAWNRREGSDGVPEIAAKLMDATGRMLKSRRASGCVSEGFFDELEYWAGLLETATGRPVGDI